MRLGMVSVLGVASMMQIRPGARSKTQVWKLSHVAVVAKESHRFLDPNQYAHAVDLCVQLAEERDPRRPPTLDVEKIEEFYELKDKGGLLGKINLRIYFAVFDDTKEIMVLGCWNKKVEGRVPAYIKTKMRARLRLVLET